MDAYDWTRFTKKVNINAPIDSISRLWSTPANIERWFLRECKINPSGAAGDPQRPITKGDLYLWRWHGYTDDVQEEGTILEANGKDLFKFTFGQVNNEYMVCTVHIFQEGGESICSITQENIPQDDRGKSYYHTGCQTGWSFYLANLKSILEGGIDLRNKNLLLKDMINS